MTVEAGGEKKELEVEKVLVAAGRAPNVEEIGLKEQGVQLTDRGFIKINERMETQRRRASTPSATSPARRCSRTRAQREGHVLAEHARRPARAPGELQEHPELRRTAIPRSRRSGSPSSSARSKKLDYKVGKFPFSANGRARTSGETEGFVKIIRDAKYGEILGAHIVGAHATELIHELAVARENEFTVEEIDLAIHAHPTLSEAVAEAALDSLGKMLHA